MIVLLTLGEGSQFVYAVTEETSSSTAPVEEVATTEEKTAESTEVSSEAATVETTASSEATENTSKKEETKEKESKKEKAEKDSIKPQAANDPVNIPDPVLNKWIRGALNYQYGPNLGIADSDPVTEEHMEKLTTLNRGSYGDAGVDPIYDLTGLEYATNLETLNFDAKKTYSPYQKNDQFTTLPANFKNLTKLKKLTFYYGKLNNIDELKDHSSLQEFSAVQNDLPSLEGLSGCTELTKITLDGSANSTYLQNGGIENFKGLEKSTKLKEIYFRKYNEQTGPTMTNVGTIEPSYIGSGLQSLDGLNCAGTLETLDLEGHPGLHTLEGLENYNKLTTLRVVGAPNYNGRRAEYTNPGGSKDLYFDPVVHTPMYNTRGLRGANAIDAISNLPSLKEVNLSSNALEDISALANKNTIQNLNLSCNLIETLQPLVTSNKIVVLDVSHNLLRNLSGLENTDTLEEIDCSKQNTGARQMPLSGSNGADYNLKGVLEDITALNSTRLKKISCYSNRLDDLSSLKNAVNLTYISAHNNDLADIKGDLAGCVNLEIAYLMNNQFESVEDIGLEDAKDSLKELILKEQGISSRTTEISQNDSAILKSLKGLKEFTVLKELNLRTNKVTDSEMKYIPSCVITLQLAHNELQHKAFETFDPNDFTRLKTLNADNNHISDITPLEKFSSTLSVSLNEQNITVTDNEGIVTLKSTPEIGLEVDILKSDKGVGLTYTKPTYGAGESTFDLKAGTNVLTINDPKYDLIDKRVTPKFSYTGNTAGFASFRYNGVLRIDVDYNVATNAELKFVPTDISGNEISEITPGGIIYWRATVNSENAQYLLRPAFNYHLQGSPHQLVNPDVMDAQAGEYFEGTRVEINGNYISTPAGFWDPQVEVLHGQINKTNIAKITIVTRVNDTALPGGTASMYFNLKGKNFPLVGLTKTVDIVASAPEELNLTAPERFDFGKKNEASKKEHSYSLDTKAHSASEQTDGFKIRVTDSKRNANRTDWKVVGQLSDLTASDGNVLKNTSLSPKLSITDISLAKITDAGGTESATNITHGSPGSPTWEQSIDLTAGGASVTISQASKADGEGVWDYQMPFDKVKLEVPSNVNNQAGYTFNGKITWTLQDAL